MIEIVPTILTSNINAFTQYFNIYKNISKRIQLDISDGVLAPTKTIQLNQIAFPDNWSGEWDIHLMSTQPSLYIEDILRLQPSLVILHAEAQENLLPIFGQLAQNGIKTGVALQKSTYPGNATQYIEKADHVLVFAGELGRQGGEADLIQIEKVKIIKNLAPTVEIGWDGGVKLENIREIAHSGVEVINVGSYFSKSSNVKISYDQLQEEAEKQGVRIE